MLITGHAQIDADHARMANMLTQFRAVAAEGDLRQARRILQDSLLICLEHWRHEDELLGQIGWSQPIIQCHQKDHSRLESRMVQALVDLYAGRPIPLDALADFEADVVMHVATYDMPLAEALRQRQTDRIARKP